MSFCSYSAFFRHSLTRKDTKNAVRLVLVCVSAGLDFAIGARSIPIIILHAANAEFSRQVGAFALPGRGNSRISLALEGSRHRIRLLRVLSHSHGKVCVCADKHGAQRKAFRTAGMQKALALDIVLCVCRSHGWLFLRLLRIHPPFSAFLPSYQNEPAFSSRNTAFFAQNDWIFRSEYTIIRSKCVMRDLAFLFCVSAEFAIVLHSRANETLTGSNGKRMIYAY